jgi:hypothetical protein
MQKHSMKTINILRTIILVLILFIVISCRSSRSTTGKQYPRTSTPQTEIPTKTETVYANTGNLPPGQAKKIYGSQSAKPYAPGQRKKNQNRYPLVIVHTPGIVIKKYSDGRYYYKNGAGYMYWKGYDGRYYLDEKHLKGMEYGPAEYDEWKIKGQKNNNDQPQKQQEQGKVKEDQQTKDTAPVTKIKEQKGKAQGEKAKDNDEKRKEKTDQNAKDESKSKGKSKGKG